MTKLTNKLFKTFLYSAVFVFVLTACESRPEGVMSKSEMIDFLTDLHKLDGALGAEGFENPDSRERVYYYNSLFKKHGITKNNFDSSLVWYSKSPKRFEKIYIEVIANLTAFDNEVKSNKYHPIDSTALRHIEDNIWPLATKYIYTKDSTRTKLHFKIITTQLQWNDIYQLSFTQRISPQDSSENKHIVMRINYSNGLTDSIYSTTQNDSLLRRFNLKLKARFQHRIDSITGELMGYSNSKGKTAATIDSVKLIRKYDSLAQDSISRVINLIENPLPIIQVIDSKSEIRLRSKVLIYKNEKSK